VFYKYGVDIILEAHEHSYERLWPVYNEVVTAKDYINPKAPIHLISGTAGCSEGVDPTLGPRGEGHAAPLTGMVILLLLPQARGLHTAPGGPPGMGMAGCRWSILATPTGSR